ncbi:MAG: hypothetical protein EOM23_03515, partial [Candidatus Moranbacteria bacterium]|nr:hypothetical protein [Candidatus Moranbacteria bacterium]
MSKKFLYFSLVYFILCCVNFSYEKFNTIDSSGIKESEITLILKSDLPFNPLRLQTVFLKDVPEDVRYVRCHISFENSVSDENFVKEHETFYPLIKQDGLQSFFNMNFFWMFDQKTLGMLESMDNTETIKFMNELPEEVEITISYDRSLSPYYELLKVDYDENSGERFASVFCDLPNGKIRLNETEHSNKYAIVFIHGVQGGQLKSVLSNFSTPPYGWRNYDRKNYWSVFYDGSLLKDFPDLSMGDFDFYEYQYDSYFDTSSGYGQKLALLLEKSGILAEYEKTILISHSMGTVVARFALNEFIPERGVYVGDEIDRLMLIGGLLEGSFFSNLSDPMVLHSKFIAVSGAADYQYDFNFENISVLYKLLNAAFDYRKLLFSPESIVDIFQTITD